MITKFKPYSFFLTLLTLVATVLSACGTRPGAETAVPATVAQPTAAPTTAAAAPSVAAKPTVAPLAVNIDCTKIQSDIKLGMDGSLTGGTADYGVGQSHGFQIAIQEYNAGGGFRGKQVGCVIYDDATKAETGQENVTRMIKQDKVVGIIGAVNSGVTLGFSKQVQESNIPLVVPISTATQITKQFPAPSYIFRLSMPDINQADTILKFAQSKGWTKVALLASTSGYSKGGQTDVEAEAPKFGIKLVTTQNFEETDTDMTAQVQAARDAGAQAVYTYALAPAIANIVKSMDKVGFKVPIIGSWTLSQPLFRRLAGTAVLKNYEVYMAQSYTIDQNDVAKALHQKTLDTYKEDLFPIATGQTYDATRLMLKALDIAGPDPKKIRDALEQVTDFKAATTAPTQLFGPNDYEGIDAYPHQLSGGMRQRIMMAMATFFQPDIILADEPTTALDVVVQKGILLLLMNLQEKMKNTIFFVSHDVGVHYQITHKMLIMYAAKVVEYGNSSDVFERPLHPYTKLLIESLPTIGDAHTHQGVAGRPPSLWGDLRGCRFADRCPLATQLCRTTEPELKEYRPGHFAACHVAESLFK